MVCTEGEEGWGGLPQAAVHPLCSPSLVHSPPLSRSSGLCYDAPNPALIATLPPALAARDQQVHELASVALTTEPVVAGE